jgi:tRNA pseudouridine55 synthase
LNQTPEPARIFLVNKPFGWSSFQAVKKMKYLLKARKCGHAGTLDPLATGLLIICTGKATKQLPEFQAQQKEYTGTITLGGITPSYDLETEVVERLPFAHITREEVEAAMAKLTGEIEQVPPVFSAVKVDGKRSYKLARQGEAKVLEPRKVLVESFEITRLDLPEVDFRVACSKGTYIRSLAHDLGKLLGCGAYLSALVRTRIGDFRIEDAHTPAEWQEILKEETALSQ